MKLSIASMVKAWKVSQIKNRFLADDDYMHEERAVTVEERKY